jgi:hypothetical protein
MPITSTNLTTLAHTSGLPTTTCPIVLSRIDDETGKRIRYPSYCRKGTCPVCKKRRQRLMAYVLIKQMETTACWHLTLTKRHEISTLRRSTKRLLRDFGRLRESAFWTRMTNGGARFIHVTYDRERLTWGPHLHPSLKRRKSPLRISATNGSPSRGILTKSLQGRLATNFGVAEILPCTLLDRLLRPSRMTHNS